MRNEFQLVLLVEQRVCRLSFFEIQSKGRERANSFLVPVATPGSYADVELYYGAVLVGVGKLAG